MEKFNKVINIENFFDFSNTGPVNRIAYTEEDAKYKLKLMQYMKQMGMQISIDDVGNICGTLDGKYETDKNLLLGSHTDSVTNGGQFDGPVGVYMAMQAIDNLRLSNQEKYGNLKAIIYACEESTRFKTACLGSYYLSGKMSYEKISQLKDKNGVTFNDAIAEYKDYIFSHLPEYGLNISDINLVDKVISQEEVHEAIEAHIEQAETLIESGFAIGAVDSIVKPLRGTLRISGKDHFVTSARIIKQLNKFAFEEAENSGSELYRITVPEFDTYLDSDSAKIVLDDNKFITITSNGKNNHSGATPMNNRQDAVLGLASLILKLDELQKENPNLSFEYLSTNTPSWGPNQIQNVANLYLKVDPPALFGVVKSLSEEVEKENNVSFDVTPNSWDVILEQTFTELFVDVRQQYPATGPGTRDKLYNLLKNIQESNQSEKSSISFRIQTMDTPVQTDNELLENIKKVCYEKKYPCQIMHSWAGHDIACVLNPDISNGKKILFFIPSEGGSHNPKETTTREAIETGTDVYYTLVSQRMEKLKELSNKKVLNSRQDNDAR